MAHDLLHLDSSARRSSFSRELSATFAATWRNARPEARYVHRDLADSPVPPIEEGWTQLCDAALRTGTTDPRRYGDLPSSDAERSAWSVVEPLLDELLAADVVLLGVPMYNFGVPASLKAWIDQVTFPRMSLAGTSFVVTGARGGAYGPGTPRAAVDHHESYLRDFLQGHFAVTDVTFLHAELTNTAVDPALEALREAHTASVVAAHAAVPAAVADIVERRAAT